MARVIHECHARPSRPPRYFAVAVRPVAGAVDGGGVSAGDFRLGNICRARLWLFCLSAGAFPTSTVSGAANCRSGIPTTTAACRSSPSGTPCRFTRPSLLYLTLPLHWSLSFFSLLHLWFAGSGHVSSRAPLDGQFLCRRLRGRRFCLQRFHAQFAHVAQPHRHVQLDALGRAGGGKRLARGRQKNSPRRFCRRAANARRRAGNHFAHLAHRVGTVAAAIHPGRSAAEPAALALPAWSSCWCLR